MGGDSLEGGTAVTGAEEEWLGLTCFLWRALQFWNHTWARRKAQEQSHISATQLSLGKNATSTALPYKHSINLNKLFKNSVDKRETFEWISMVIFFGQKVAIWWFIFQNQKLWRGEVLEFWKSSPRLLWLACGTKRKTEKVLVIRTWKKKKPY